MSDATIVITRVLPAPRDAVWTAWTDAEQLAAWYGPSQFSNENTHVDLRPGGNFEVTMVSPDGMRFPTGGEFLEVVPPERLVYRENTAELSDQFDLMVRGQLESIGADPNQDTRSIVTVTFEEHETGTLLTIHTRFPSEAVRQAVGNMRMEDGWNQSLDTLADTLARR